MRKTKRNQKSNPDRYDPYEESLRLENLDPYEALIQSNLFEKKSINK